MNNLIFMIILLATSTGFSKALISLPDGSQHQANSFHVGYLDFETMSLVIKGESKKEFIICYVNNYDTGNIVANNDKIEMLRQSFSDDIKSPTTNYYNLEQNSFWNSEVFFLKKKYQLISDSE